MARETTRSYEKAIDAIARQLSKSDWSFSSYSGAYSVGSSGKGPFPDAHHVLAPYLKEFSPNPVDNITGYALNRQGRDLLDISFSNLGSGRLEVEVDFNLPNFNPPYSTERFIASVKLDQPSGGGFRKGNSFSLYGQSIADGDSTYATWIVSGRLGDGLLSAYGLDRSLDGLVHNIDALIITNQ